MNVRAKWTTELFLVTGKVISSLVLVVPEAVRTLVERSTRFVLVLHLPNNHWALAVEESMRHAIATLPNELMRSIT